VRERGSLGKWSFLKWSAEYQTVSCHILDSGLNTLNFSRGRILRSNWDKSLKEFSSLLFTDTSTNKFYSPSPLSKCGLKPKSENSKDYAQKSQRHCMFMNSASDLWYKTVKSSINHEVTSIQILSP
jgi:hypothetical protein